MLANRRFSAAECAEIDAILGGPVLAKCSHDLRVKAMKQIFTALYIALPGRRRTDREGKYVQVRFGGSLARLLHRLPRECGRNHPCCPQLNWPLQIGDRDDYGNYWDGEMLPL